MDSFYDDPKVVSDQILRGRYRDVIGGRWDELGQLQLDFMVSAGLEPHHVLLDIGCGSLRGGVKFIPYLAPGNYWGVDKNDALLRVGYDLELRRAGLTARQPREQIVCLPDFEFDRLDAACDYAIAQSLFTHLSHHGIRRCLTRVMDVMKPGARLYATFFELEAGEDREEAKLHPDGVTVSYGDRSFYHYRVDDFRAAITGLPATLDRVGDWGHPRGQRMIAVTRVDG